MSDDNKDLGDDLEDMIGDAKDSARKAGEKISQKASELSDDAKEFANEAKENQLVDVIADKELMKDITEEYISFLKKNEPNAVARCKQLLNDLVLNRVHEPIAQHTTRLLAEVRKSEAASQRIEKFFKKANKRNED